uniref:Uncharacterized protein n=1 Tax=Setaria viridis TaxID=4556 RepID=A0A4U6TVK2_SETVI|nr:hypothetical protein SEVIR_8G199600v2 [Setaria viridis]
MVASSPSWPQVTEEAKQATSTASIPLAKPAITLCLGHLRGVARPVYWYQLIPMIFCKISRKLLLCTVYLRS